MNDNVEVRFEVSKDDQQYVKGVADVVDNSHFIFARIRQVTTAVTMRVSWTLTPRLGFQLYAQPFVSTGSYREYEGIDNPGANNYRDRFYQYNVGDINVGDNDVSVLRDRCNSLRVPSGLNRFCDLEPWPVGLK